MWGDDQILKSLGCGQKKWEFKCHFEHVVIITSSWWLILWQIMGNELEIRVMESQQHFEFIDPQKLEN
jgi:hypothetical protein